jgi:hypothetical protein
VKKDSSSMLASSNEPDAAMTNTTSSGNLGRIKSMAKSKSVPARLPLSSKNSDKNATEDGKNDTGFTEIESVPHGLSPPSMKECHLSNVVRSAQRCLDHLRDVRECLSNLVAEDESMSKGVKKVEQTPEILQLANIAETITAISREAFIPAHRLNQTAVALYNAEDFLRYPTDIRTFDIASTGRIKLPDASFNASTLEKLRSVVDKTTGFYNKFDGKGPSAGALQDILFTLMRAMQDLYACTLGCQEVFKILLYTSSKEKQHLQQFLLALPSMERSDMLTEIQDLRRLIDELVIFLEKLSWGAFVVYRLATGRTSIGGSNDESPESPSSGLANLESSHPTYPGYPSYANGNSPASASPRDATTANSINLTKTKSDKKKFSILGGISKNKNKSKTSESGDNATNIAKSVKIKSPADFNETSVVVTNSGQKKVKAKKQVSQVKEKTVKETFSKKKDGNSEATLWLSYADRMK